MTSIEIRFWYLVKTPLGSKSLSNYCCGSIMYITVLNNFLLSSQHFYKYPLIALLLEIFKILLVLLSNSISEIAGKHSLTIVDLKLAACYFYNSKAAKECLYVCHRRYICLKQQLKKYWDLILKHGKGFFYLQGKLRWSIRHENNKFAVNNNS